MDWREDNPKRDMTNALVVVADEHGEEKCRGYLVAANEGRGTWNLDVGQFGEGPPELPFTPEDGWMLASDFDKPR